MSRSPRLTINVFTPLPPAATEIANVNVSVILEMAKTANVVVWTPQDTWSPLTDDTISVRSFRSDSISYTDLNKADTNIFHIGNNVQYHQDIYDLCQLVPGIVVIHDINLHHFLLGLYHTMGRKQSYFSAIERCHGVAGRELAKLALAGAGSASVIEELPATLAPTARATALVLHNRAAADALRRETAVAVNMLPLAFTDRTWPQQQRPRPVRPPYSLILFGFLSRNRGVETILRVIADSSVRRWFTLDIFGEYHDPEALAGLLGELDLADRVRVHGFVSVPVLDRALDEADLALNLRNPTVGEASASQLRIWAHGLPSIVTRVGWYGQQPETCCHFIDPGSEETDLHHALIDFCCNPERWRCMGKAGHNYVHRHHGPAQYASGLLDIVARRGPQGIARLSRDLAERVQKDAAFTEPALRRALVASVEHLFDDLAASCCIVD